LLNNKFVRAKGARIHFTFSAECGPAQYKGAFKKRPPVIRAKLILEKGERI
jgi:hypothetical protein